MVRLRFVFLSFGLIAAVACASEAARPGFDGNTDDVVPPPFEDSGTFSPDANQDSGDSGFQTCAAASVEATPERLPVDIIWIVDNSSSMQPAVAEVQAGLNAFAALIDTKGIDYKVVMLSKRGATPSGSTYPVCIPPPLGGADCANGPRFFHASMNVKSTQPLEQFLGTLDQTAGYTQGDDRGSEPWSQELRVNATKTIVVVTDDDSRFSATSFETFPGGKNPYNSTTLPPGVLDPSRGNQFKGYTFSGIYGWGSLTVPSLRCTYPGGTEQPAASGETYTDLVTKTGGVRAKICDGSAAWGPFMNSVAEAVVSTSRIACELAIPEPDGGTVNPEQVNVRVSNGTDPEVVVPRVADEAACGTAAGWYYDNPSQPTKVHLCTSSCDAAQGKGGAKPPKVEILFGCQSIVR